MFVERVEKAGLLGFAYFRQGDNCRLAGAKTDPGGKNATRIKDKRLQITD